MDKGEIMKLYHPSDRKFKIVKVEYFGENYYTQGDVHSSKVKRTFWYLKSNIPEDRFKDSKYLYVAEINPEKLYDLRYDSKRLIGEFRNVDKLLKYLRKHYMGTIYNVGFDLVVLFKNIKPIKIIKKEI